MKRGLATRKNKCRQNLFFHGHTNKTAQGDVLSLETAQNSKIHDFTDETQNILIF